MLDPGLVARARRWGLFTSFSSFAFQLNKNVMFRRLWLHRDRFSTVTNVDASRTVHDA